MWNHIYDSHRAFIQFNVWLEPVATGWQVIVTNNPDNKGRMGEMSIRNTKPIISFFVQCDVWLFSVTSDWQVIAINSSKQRTASTV